MYSVSTYFHHNIISLIRVLYNEIIILNIHFFIVDGNRNSIGKKKNCIEL